MAARGINTLQTTRVPIKTSAHVATFINFSVFHLVAGRAGPFTTLPLSLRFSPLFSSPFLPLISQAIHARAQRSFSSRRNELPHPAEFSFSICWNDSITKTTFRGVRGYLRFHPQNSIEEKSSFARWKAPRAEYSVIAIPSIRCATAF